MGSEQGMAWNWITNIGRYCKVYVVTEGEWKDEIEAAILNLSYRENIKFHYNPVSEKIRKMCWNQGDWRFYYHYKKWQKKTLKIAQQIIIDHKIDIVHQLNMIGFREPGYLWKIKTIPFIWGPVDAKAKFPIAYLEGASLKSKLFIWIKNLLTNIQLRTSSRVKDAVKKSSFVVSASSDSLSTFKKYFDCDSVLINETGCFAHQTSVNKLKNVSSPLNLLWVGKFEFRKQLSLALRTIGHLTSINIVLHLVGGDEETSQYFKLQAEELKIANNCIWHGKISHDEVQKLMLKSDLFFFTSVAEGTPHVVLEAISNQLPVLCFNCCGQGDSVNENVGIKIQLSNPSQSVKDFSDKIKYLNSHRDELLSLSQNCFFRQQELSWENKALKMVELYNQSVMNFRKGN